MDRKEVKWVAFNISHVQGLKTIDNKIPKETSFGKTDKFSLVYGQDILLLVFFVPLGKGNINVFLKPGAEIRTYKKLVMQSLINGLDDYQALTGTVRFQANTKDEPLYRSFMTRLGFVQETILEKYNDGIDYILWKRIYGS